MAYINNTLRMNTHKHTASHLLLKTTAVWSVSPVCVKMRPFGCFSWSKMKLSFSSLTVVGSIEWLISHPADQICVWSVWSGSVIWLICGSYLWEQRRDSDCQGLQHSRLKGPSALSREHNLMARVATTGRIGREIQAWCGKNSCFCMHNKWLVVDVICATTKKDYCKSCLWWMQQLHPIHWRVPNYAQYELQLKCSGRIFKEYLISKEH